MKKSLFSLVAILWIAGFTELQAEKIVPSKEIVSRNIQLSQFSEVETNTFVDIVFSSSSSQKITLEAPANLIKYIDVKVKGTKLTVGLNKRNLNVEGNVKSKLIVYAPEVNRFFTNSSGSITLAKGLNISGTVELRSNSAGNINAPSIVCDELNISANSAGDIEIKKISAIGVNMTANSAGDIEVENIKAGYVKCYANSAGDIEIAGSCDKAELYVNSAGSIDAEKLKAKDVTAISKSAGNIDCYVTEKLDAGAYSVGNVTYKGQPSELTQRNNKVRRKN